MSDTVVEENIKDQEKSEAEEDGEEYNIEDYIFVHVEKGGMARKLEQAAPYNIFLTSITDTKETHEEPLTVTMQEILDESLGEIESSVQFNFMVDIDWLQAQYHFAGILDKPLLVFHGWDQFEEEEKKPNVTGIRVEMASEFATSHTKMMLFHYKDGGMRVVISTANLYAEDWFNRTQGVWISPTLPALPDDTSDSPLAGESVTGFRSDLIHYLSMYKFDELQPWIERIAKCDFSAVNVFLVASIPGEHHESPVHGHAWGCTRLGALLAKHSTSIADTIPVVCQSSSIGYLGKGWLQQFLHNLRRDSLPPKGPRRLPPFKMIYPSFSDRQNCLRMGNCLPYMKCINDRQPWLRLYLQHWRSDKRHRTHAMPHHKCYTRFNLNDRCVYWYLLTSANLSKTAWGTWTEDHSLKIGNWEAGVLFLPRIVIGEETFPLENIGNNIPPFPLPYDLPLTPYGPDDKPFVAEDVSEDSSEEEPEE